MTRRALLAALLLAVPAPLAAGVPLVELKTGDRAFHGRVVAKDANYALLVDRDGSMCEVPLAEVTAFSVAAPSFRPYSSVDIRDRLLRVVAKVKNADAYATPHYVVVGRPAAARAVGEALEEVYDGYRWYCSTRNFKIAQPEFPLVAIVFPTRADFDAYCRADDVPPSGSLQGYYSPQTNRFVCYESDRVSGHISGDLKDTVAHEAIHQVAFNTGLHVRGGGMPVWVAEGLATALEPEAARRPLRSESPPLDRANPERLSTFLAAARGGSQIRAEQLVATDDAFDSSTLDAYAAAWALTFYLMETKPTAYGRYLKTIAARDPLDEYEPAERVEDFRAAFGSEWKMLDAELVRFQNRIAAGERR